MRANSLFVDLGFSSVKATDGEKMVKIPSAVRRVYESGEIFDNQLFQVGEQAIGGHGAVAMRSLNDLIQFYPVFVGVVARELGMQGASKLVVGLPARAWEVAVEAKKNNLENLIDQISGVLRSFTFSGVTYTFDAVEVKPQCYAGLGLYLRERPKLKDRILTVDIGYNTRICVLWDPVKNKAIHTHTKYTGGVTTLAENFIRPIVNKYLPDMNFTASELCAVLESGHLQCGAVTHNLRPELDQAVQLFIVDLLKDMIRTITERCSTVTFRTVLFIGGGARLIQNINLEASNVNLEVSEHFEFANVKGFAAAETDRHRKGADSA
jgi:hypothetical protein